MKSTMKNMVVSLTFIAAVMGGVLAAVFSLTEEPVNQAALKAKTEAFGEILPAFDNDPLSTAVEVTIDPTLPSLKVYTATKNGQLAGKAVETTTLDGFSGEIVMMVGFNADGAVSGYKVLKHAETPGLGAKADEWFRDPTAKRSIIGTTTPLAVSKDGGEIDGITAATITSRAILQAVNNARKGLE